MRKHKEQASEKIYIYKSERKRDRVTKTHRGEVKGKGNDH